MKEKIPAAVISVVSRILPDRYTAERLNNLFEDAGATGEIPVGSKEVRAETWLRRANKTPGVEPLQFLGKIIEELMEGFSRPDEINRNAIHREEIENALKKYGLSYSTGGRVFSRLGGASRTLKTLIQNQDLVSIDEEFERAMKSIEDSPRDAVSAASNILEIACKVIIEAEEIPLPAKEDLNSVWNVIRKHLGIDASVIEDQDINKIVTGLCSVVGGIGALRTHASSAHGNAHKKYKLEPRHARLSVHSAHTVTMFLIESWTDRRGTYSHG